MRVCPSQHIKPNQAFNKGWKESGTGLCINSRVSKYTKSCSVDESPIFDFDINEITFLDYKIPNQSLPDEDLSVLEQYLLTDTLHKTLHIVNIGFTRPLLFNPNWEPLVRFLNSAEKRSKPMLEILNLDYNKLTPEGKHPWSDDSITPINTDWWQIDYHHVLSDSVAFHYPIYLSPEADIEWVERYNKLIYHIQPQPVQYDPESDRERFR